MQESCESKREVIHEQITTTTKMQKNNIKGD